MNLIMSTMMILENYTEILVILFDTLFKKYVYQIQTDTLIKMLKKALKG
jgi:hypothetical protein